VGKPSSNLRLLTSNVLLPPSSGTAAGKLASILRPLNATSPDLSNDHFAL
jgi:hypothetical protein